MAYPKINAQECNQHFETKSKEIRAGPVPSSHRSCNDICCLITFILIVIGAGVIGSIMISDGRQFYHDAFYGTGTKVDISGLASVFSTQGGIIAGMFCLSIILAILFVFLLKMFPKCMVYSMIGLIYITFIALIVVGIIKFNLVDGRHFCCHFTDNVVHIVLLQR